MTKKLIDAEALLEFLDDRHGRGSCGCVENLLFVFKEKINELSTPAPEQESIFDADGWCWDMDKVPLQTDVMVLVSGEGYDKISVGSKSFKNGELNVEIRDTWNNCEFLHLAWRPLPNIPSKGDL